MTEPKHCACGLSHDAASWSALPLVGEMSDEDGRLELRDCACGSTLAVALCIVTSCDARAEWGPDESLSHYCEAHSREWLMSEASIERREVAA